MFRNLRGLKYEYFNILEWMHNLARVFENCQNLLVGKDSEYDKKARRTSRELNLFPRVWTTQVTYLAQVTLTL